jgi:hypothetical protein
VMHVSPMREMANAYILVGNPLGRRALGNFRGRWVIGHEGIDWIHVAQDRDQWRALLITVTNLRVP